MLMLKRCILMAVSMACAGLAFAHGDVTPQAVDTSRLPTLGAEWRDVNPYRDLPVAVEVGSSAFNQNCARCHGLEAISGGIAPDLRKLDLAPDTDEYFVQSVRRGKIRNGMTYMPPFEAVLNQEAMWAIKAYLESRRASLTSSR
jgi:cytochrome c-550 PedF